MQNTKEEIPCSERTLYRYIDSGILSVRNIDLPRKVKYKPRRQSDTSEKLTRECTIGRTYTHFLEYLEQYPETNVVEMDTADNRHRDQLFHVLRECVLII